MSQIDRNHLQRVADSHADVYWRKFRRVFGNEIQPETPKVILCNRLKTTAGYAYYDAQPQYIRLSIELFWQYQHSFVVDTIPHELAHLVAYSVHGDPGHGEGWYKIIEQFDINTKRLHNYVNDIHETRKLKRIAGL